MRTFLLPIVVVLLVAAAPRKTGVTKGAAPAQSARSPLVVEHAVDAVRWREWSAETLAAARRENKPVFLAIGAFGSHDGHRMRREAFADTAVGASLNGQFVAVLVDADEHPDVARAYGAIAATMGVPASPPLEVVLAPDATPIFAAGYL